MLIDRLACFFDEYMMEYLGHIGCIFLSKHESLSDYREKIEQYQKLPQSKSKQNYSGKKIATGYKNVENK